MLAPAPTIMLTDRLPCLDPPPPYHLPPSPATRTYVGTGPLCDPRGPDQWRPLCGPPNTWLHRGHTHTRRRGGLLADACIGSLRDGRRPGRPHGRSLRACARDRGRARHCATGPDPHGTCHVAHAPTVHVRERVRTRALGTVCQVWRSGIFKDTCSDAQDYASGSAAPSGHPSYHLTAIARIVNMRRDRPPM